MFSKIDISHPELLLSAKKIAIQEIPKYIGSNTFPRKLFNTFAENGLTALGLDEEFGGIDCDNLTKSLIIEQVAEVALGPAIFLSVHNMVTSIIHNYGTIEQKKKYLPQLVTGKLLGAFALSEPHAGSDAAALKTNAKTEKGEFVLNGSKAWITSASHADLYLTFALTDNNETTKGISAFIVEKEDAGLSFGPPENKMGCELSPIASLFLEDLQVSQDRLLGNKNEGYKIALSGLCGGRVSIASAANGISKNAIRKSIDYIKERQQFGQPLINFQGLQFMIADMVTKLEASRLLSRSAAESLHTKEEKIKSSMAKCFATDSCMEITTDAVQLLGAVGYMKEYGVEKLMRDAKMLQIVEGTNQIQRIIISKEFAS